MCERKMSEQGSDLDSMYQKKATEESSIVWTYNKVLILMQILRWSVEKNVPASQMGIFLVEVLYRTDAHMNNRVTRLVDSGETYGNVAKAVLLYYQIRDEKNRPLWTKLLPGHPDLRPELVHAPLDDNNFSERHSKRYGISQIHEELVIFAPKPVRRVRWPFWPSDAELESAPDYQKRYKNNIFKGNDYSGGTINDYGRVVTGQTIITDEEPLFV
ncbi:unnamed protein product [Penicillium pancosmium]